MSHQPDLPREKEEKNRGMEFLNLCYRGSLSKESSNETLWRFMARALWILDGNKCYPLNH